MKERNHFNKSNQGLYDAAYEHDACGVGMIVNIHGEKSHDIVEAALKVLENMRHRGAEGADNKTGDGAGIMVQIPHEFILLQGIPVPEKGKYVPYKEYFSIFLGVGSNYVGQKTLEYIVMR